MISLKALFFGESTMREEDKRLAEGLAKRFSNGDIFINDKGQVEVTDQGRKNILKEYEEKYKEKPIMGK